jgi:hypothetical protein
LKNNLFFILDVVQFMKPIIQVVDLYFVAFHGISHVRNTTCHQVVFGFLSILHQIDFGFLSIIHQVVFGFQQLVGTSYTKLLYLTF